jgi:hypothetical protein
MVAANDQQNDEAEIERQRHGQKPQRAISNPPSGGTDGTHSMMGAVVKL